MGRQKRLIQAAVHVLRGSGRAGVSAMERIASSSSSSSWRKYGIPNIVQRANTLPYGAFISGNRPHVAAPASRPVFSFIPSSLIGWGSLVEVCSSSPQLSRDVSMQAAQAEAVKGKVLWLAVGSSGAAAAGCSSSSFGFRQAPNLTVQHWPIASAADTDAVLQHLLQQVRSQRYIMVVLDDVVGLAPPVPGRGRRPPSQPQLESALQPTGPPPAPAEAAPAEVVAAAPACADLASPAAALHHAAGTSGWEAGASASASTGPVQSLTLTGSSVQPTDTAAAAAAIPPPATPAAAPAEAAQGTADGQPTGPNAGVEPAAGPGTAVAGPGTGPGEQRGLVAVPHRPSIERGLPGSQQQRPTCLANGSLGASGDRPARLNFKFLNNTLPVLLEEVLGQLSASCGPDLRTTTLILNSYDRPREQTATTGSASGSSGAAGSTTSSPRGSGFGGGGRGVGSRWAQRAIIRHATATLHLSREQLGGRAAGAAGPAAAGVGGGAKPGAAAGWAAVVQRGGTDLHAEVTTGPASGEHGPARYVGSIVAPVRLTPEPAHSSTPDWKR